MQCQSKQSEIQQRDSSSKLQTSYEWHTCFVNSTGADQLKQWRRRQLVQSGLSFPPCLLHQAFIFSLFHLATFFNVKFSINVKYILKVNSNEEAESNWTHWSSLYDTGPQTGRDTFLKRVSYWVGRIYHWLFQLFCLYLLFLMHLC